MGKISVTHYTKGEGAPFYLPGEEYLSVQDALTDVFSRLRNGAGLGTSGYNYGLVTYVGPEENPTGSDKAIYGGLSPKLQDFLIRATKWWEQGDDTMPGTPEHEHFIRRLLLEATGHDLSTTETDIALNMAEDQFLAAIAMAIETGDNVAELFSPSTVVS